MATSQGNNSVSLRDRKSIAVDPSTALRSNSSSGLQSSTQISKRKQAEFFGPIVVVIAVRSSPRRAWDESRVISAILPVRMSWLRDSRLKLRRWIRSISGF